MEGITSIVLLIALLAYYAQRRAARKILREEKPIEKIYFAAQYPEMERAINEATSVLSNTKDIETGVRSFAAIRSYLVKMASISPSRMRISISLNKVEMGREIEIGTKEADESIKKLEEDWIRATCLDRIGTFMRQSEETSDPVMSVEFVRDALRVAYNGLEYLSGDGELLARADIAERRLKYLSGNAGL